MWNKEKSKVNSQKSRTGNNGILFIVSAPSGAGKTTLCRKAVDYFDDMRHSISYTTRAQREGEEDGADYHFISEDAFHGMLERQEFLEWAEVHGNKYGTSLNDIRKMLSDGLDIILDIDVQGAKQVKNKVVAGEQQLAVFVFILPPSMNVCEERIMKRGKDSHKAISSRLENARAEIKELVWYDYVIINDNLEDAFERLTSIIIAEKSRRERMMEQVTRLYGEVIGRNR